MSEAAPQNLQLLQTLYRAAQLYAHNAHNVASGPTFFEDHEFLGELYGAYESAYDSLVERSIGLGASPDLMAIQEDAVNTLAAWGLPSDNASAFGYLLQIERQLCAELEKQGDCEMVTSIGVQTLLGDLANESEARQYKLSRRLQ